MDEGLCIKYIDKKFSPESMSVLRNSNIIIDEYRKRGYVLTLRQLFYQHVARDLLPNSQKSYSRLGDIISDGRLAGLIPWDAIEDRGRSLMGLRNYTAPGQAVKSAADDYRIDMWANQDFRPEVWVEKAALEGVIGTICNKLRVNFFATKGYNSQSEQWRAGQRMAGYIRKGQRPIVFHLGDHDPSGLDMTRDVRDRMAMFVGQPVIVQRLALNMPQVDQYSPPPNPVKVRADGELADSRGKAYVEEFGHSSWELDALSPEVIHSVIEDAVSKIRNLDRWEEMMEQEVEDRRVLESVMENLGYGDSDDED